VPVNRLQDTQSSRKPIFLQPPTSRTDVALGFFFGFVLVETKASPFCKPFEQEKCDTVEAPGEACFIRDTGVQGVEKKPMRCECFTKFGALRDVSDGTGTSLHSLLLWSKGVCAVSATELTRCEL